MDLDIQFSMLYSYIFLQNLEKQVNQKSQSIPQVTHHDEYRDNVHNNYNTSNTSKVDEALFKRAGSTDKQVTSTLRQKGKVERDKLQS